jgi:eukaryotic-like serine/threonine-protein kinase
MADFGGRYRQVRLLGTGGMGEVWLALDEELGERPVAIKRMHSRMLADAEDVARFQREMRLAARMQHPNIMTLFTTGTDNGIPFMVMEYLEGQDLGKASRIWSAAEAARVGRDTCAALEYAHDMGVVHRDIKPGNLFLCDTGQVKVTDFGIAKAVSGTSLTATGTLVGTLPYMAPEQWLGETAAFSNDIWAIGCVLYELLSGRPPRTYASATDYVAAAARRDAVPRLQPNASTPAWLADAIMAMLEPDPRRRPSAAECVQLLSGPSAQFQEPAAIRRPIPAAAYSPAEPSGALRTSAAPAARSRSSRIALSVAALVAVAAGGTALALMHGTPKGSGQPGVPGAAAGPAVSRGTTQTSPQASSTGHASPSALSHATVTSSGTPMPNPAVGVWIAQLASVPVSAGFAKLQRELAQVRAEIPGAQYLVSSDYASLNPGYWVIYYLGSFSDGTQAIEYCAAHGRTSTTQCVGRFLSHDLRDKTYICFPPGGSQEKGCSRPA